METSSLCVSDSFPSSFWLFEAPSCNSPCLLMTQGPTILNRVLNIKLIRTFSSPGAQRETLDSRLRALSLNPCQQVKTLAVMFGPGLDFRVTDQGCHQKKKKGILSFRGRCQPATVSLSSQTRNRLFVLLFPAELITAMFFLLVSLKKRYF